MILIKKTKNLFQVLQYELRHGDKQKDKLDYNYNDLIIFTQYKIDHCYNMFLKLTADNCIDFFYMKQYHK